MMNLFYYDGGMIMPNMEEYEYLSVVVNDTSPFDVGCTVFTDKERPGRMVSTPLLS